jgi:hypothetical protein
MRHNDLFIKVIIIILIKLYVYVYARKVKYFEFLF